MITRVCAMVLVSAWLMATSVFAVIESREFDATKFDSLKIKNSSGNIVISVSKDKKAYVKADKKQFGKKCVLNMNQVKNELVVEVKHTGMLEADQCEVNLSLEVPAAVAMEIKNGSGNLDINGTKGDIDFRLGSGNAKIVAGIDKLQGKSGSGDIEASGLNGSVEVKTGSGNVKLSYQPDSQKGYIDVNTGSGNVGIYLPATVLVSTNFKAGSGQLSSEFGNSTNAAFKIDVKTGSGNLDIKKL